MSLNAATINVDVEATELGAQDMGLSKLVHRLMAGSGPFKQEFATGTATDQSDRVWSDSNTLVGTTVTIDLAGTLTSVLDGTVVTFAEITAIIIRNKATTAGYLLTIGNATAPLLNVFGAGTHTLKLGPGGILVLTNPVDGYAVTATSQDGLKIDSGANTVPYEIIIIGRSA